MKFNQQKYEQIYLPLFLTISCVALEGFYILIAWGMNYLDFLKPVLKLDWSAASNSMEIASGSSTAIIFVGIIILEVFSNRYFPVIKYFFYNFKCLFIFTYSVSVTIFSYFSIISHEILPYAPFTAFILLSLLMILLGLYFVFYTITWISPNYTIQLMGNDIKGLLTKVIRIGRNRSLSEEEKNYEFLEIKKELFQLLSYIMAATNDIDKMVVNKAVYSISDILRTYHHIKEDIPSQFFILTDREREDKGMAYLGRFVDIENNQLFMEAKCLSLLNDIFAILLANNKYGPENITGVIDEYTDLIIYSKKFSMPLIHLITQVHFRFLDTTLEYNDEFVAVRILDRMYWLLKKFLIIKFMFPDERFSAEIIYQSIEDVVLRMKNYTTLFYRKNLTDVLEKVANLLFLFLRDIINENESTLIPLEETFISTFLQVDMKPDPTDSKDRSLLNVRVSQALLGTIYEKILEHPPANSVHTPLMIRQRINQIVGDMNEEDLPRILAIKQMTLTEIGKYHEIDAHSVERFFSRFVIKTLVISQDPRFDATPPPGLSIIRSTTIRDAIIKMSMLDFHLIILDDIPVFISFDEMLDLLLNYTPSNLKALILVEFGNSEMKKNLYKFTALRIPFTIKFFDDTNQLNFDELMHSTYKVVYNTNQNIAALRPNLEKLKKLFEI